MYGINSIVEKGESQQSSRYSLVYPGLVSSLKTSGEFRIFGEFRSPIFLKNKTPKVVFVGCVGLWKHNGVLSEFGKIKETGKMCHVMSIDE